MNHTLICNACGKITPRKYQDCVFCEAQLNVMHEGWMETPAELAKSLNSDRGTITHNNESLTIQYWGFSLTLMVGGAYFLSDTSGG